MSTIFFSLLIILLLIIFSSFIYGHISPTIERFEQLPSTLKKRLDATFGQGTCDILRSNSLPTLTKVTADSYLDTGRIKALKSVKKSQDDSINSQATCYINNDIEKNAQDYFMSGRSCKISDFQNIPFIQDVYLDDSTQTTTTTTPYKCVFKIDPLKVDDETLTEFWNGVRQSECVQMNEFVIDANQHLRDKYTESTKIVKILKNDTVNQEIMLAKQSQYIATSNTIIDQLMENLSTSNLVLKDLIRDIGSLRENIYDYSCNCAYTTSRVSDNLNTCQESLVNIKAKYAPISSSLSNLKTDMASYQIKYDGLNNNINIKSSLLNTLQKTFNTRFNAYESLNNIYSKCMSSNETCRNNLISCQSNLLSHTSYYNEQVVNSNTCHENHVACMGNLAICNTSKTAIQVSIDKHTNLFNECLRNKTRCIQDNSREQSKIQGYTQDYAYVQQYYNYKTCQPFEKEHEDLSRHEADLLSRCQRASDQSDQTASSITSTINTITTSMNNSLASCHKKESEPTLIAPTYHHHTFHFHWTNGTGGWSSAIAEGMSSTSAENAKQKVVAIVNPLSPPWENGNWKNQGWYDQPSTSTTTTSNYNYKIHLEDPSMRTDGSVWLVRTGGPSEINVKPVNW